MESPSRDPEPIERSLPRKRSFRILLAAAAVLLLLEVPLHFGDARHGYFGIDGWFGFYALLGLAASALVLLAAKALAGLVTRDETYYGDAEDDTPPTDIDESLR